MVSPRLGAPPIPFGGPKLCLVRDIADGEVGMLLPRAPRHPRPEATVQSPQKDTSKKAPRERSAAALELACRPRRRQKREPDQRLAVMNLIGRNHGHCFRERHPHDLDFFVVLGLSNTLADIAR
jgi:hypothetical protein